MKRKSCAHWNYGYYGPERKCMIGRECHESCGKYDRRSGNGFRKTEPSKTDILLYKNCVHKELIVADGKLVRMCALEVKLDRLGRCSARCILKENHHEASE